MNNEQLAAKAQEVYGVLIRMLDSKGLRYTKMEEDLAIRCTINGDDLPMDIVIRVIAKNQVIQLISPLPCDMPSDKRVDGAIAVCVANYSMIDGSFDYDVSDGTLMFRLTSSYHDCVISEELFEYMLGVSVSTIDHYNDKFFMLAKGMMSIQQFLKDNA